jgi:hypothetical protein
MTLAGNESMNAGTVTSSGAAGFKQATAQATAARRAKGFKLLVADVGLTRQLSCKGTHKSLAAQPQNFNSSFDSFSVR